jgi:hypothetical protein
MKNNKGIRVKKKPFVISLILFWGIELISGFSDDAITALLRFIVCLIFCYCIYKGGIENKIINPYFLFSLTPFSLLVYNEKISSYYLKRLDNRTWFLAIINMLFFLLAYRLTSTSFISFGEKNHKKSSLSIRRIKRHAILLAIIGRIPTIIKFLTGFTMPLASVIGFLPYIGIAFAFKSKDIKMIILTSIITSTMFLTDFNKTRFLYLGIVIFVCIEFYFVKNVKDKRRFVFSLLGGILIFLIIAFPLKSFIRNGGSYFEFMMDYNDISSNAFSHYENRITFNGPSFLEMPYMYLVSAWNNLQYIMDTQNSRTYGLWMIKPILGYLQIDEYFNSFYKLVPYSTFNTYTYIAVLFKDFGYYGSVLGSVFLGAYVKLVRRSAVDGGSAFCVAAYALVSMATLEMFFSNHFFGLSYPFTIVIIGWIYKKIFKLEGY